MEPCIPGRGPALRILIPYLLWNWCRLICFRYWRSSARGLFQASLFEGGYQAGVGIQNVDGPCEMLIQRHTILDLMTDFRTQARRPAAEQSALQVGAHLVWPENISLANPWLQATFAFASREC